MLPDDPVFCPNPDSRFTATAQLLLEALSQAGDAVILIDAQERVVYLNSLAAQQYEVDPASALGCSRQDLYHYRWFQPTDEQAAQAALQQQGRWRGRNFHVLPGGKVLPVESTVTRIRAAGHEYLLTMIRDITAYQQTESALRETEQIQRLAMEGGQLGTWAIDLDTQETFWGLHCRQILGVTPDEPATLDKSFALIHPDDRLHAIAAIAAVAAHTTDHVMLEVRIRWPDASTRWVAVRGSTFAEDTAGRATRRLIGVVLDITERKHYEQSLLHANQRLALAEEAAHALLYEWNLITGVVERSGGTFHVLGYHPDELASNLDAWRALIHPDDAERVIALRLSQPASGQRLALEYRLRHRDGHYVHVWDQSIVVCDAARGPLSIIGITADISERKHMEQKLHETQERFRVALASAPLTIGQVDQDLRYTWLYNPHPDYRDVDALGKRYDELASNSAANRYVAAQREVLATGQRMRAEFAFPLSDGEHVYDVRLEPLRAADGAIIGVTSVTLEITELKQVQARLQELNDTLEQRIAERTVELERSNLELERFAYVASHDLKAPLRAIDSLSQWLEEDLAGMLPPPAQVHLDKLRGRVKRLELLLDDLLLYSRAGRKRYAPEMVDPAALVAGIVDLLSPPPGFQITVDGPLPTLHAVRPPLETVLRNLLQNAIKHHDRPQEGRVTISAHRQQPGWVEFCVCDNGPGIDPRFHERIFELFQTLRSRDDLEGSGMGLAIVKKTVESFGGSIRVESVPGQGAAFFFTWRITADSSTA